MIIAGIDFENFALMSTQARAINLIRSYVTVGENLLAYEVVPYFYLSGAQCRGCNESFDVTGNVEIVIEFAQGGEAIYHLRCRPAHPWWSEKLRVDHGKLIEDVEQLSLW